MASVRQLGELGLIRRLREPHLGPGVTVGIGDDTAVLALSPGTLLLATTDLLVEDVHFRRASATFTDIGWKSMAVNLSDIAAMGGIPRWALVGLAMPAEARVEEVDELYRGMREAAAPHAVAVVGGDTSASPGGFVIDVTLLGEHPGTPRLRSMARAGHAVAVTGSLGRSAAGLAVLERGTTGTGSPPIDPGAIEEIVSAHRRPQARVAEGRWLAEQSAVHALMDCSDGLATDLGHICAASGVRATVELAQVPVAPAVRQAARALGQDPVDWATAGGEDYELLLTCEAEDAPRLADGLLRATGTALTVVGHIAAGEPGVDWLDGNGRPVRIRAGYEHFRG